MTRCFASLLVTLATMALVGCEGRTADPASAAPTPTAPALTFRSTDITGATFANRLALPDVEGRQRTLADWKGKVTVVFFGYTQCPDVCPTTMAELSRIRKTLGPGGDKLQVVFVTVDPERDTAPILKEYVANFGPGVTALRGSVEQTKDAAKEFKVFFAKVPGKSPGSYTIDHTAAAFVLDAAGRPRLYVPYDGDAKALESDLKTLVAAA